MATANFFAPGSEWELAQQEAARQRQMADALRQQSQAPLQGGMAGRVYVPPSITQGLAKLLQGYMSGKMGTAADENLRTAKSANDQRRTQGMNSIVDALSGRPAQQFDMPANEMGDEATTGMSAAVAPDMNKALAQAMQMRDDPMAAGIGQKIIDSKMAAMIPKAQEAFTLAPGAVRYGPDGKQVAAAPAPFTLAPGATRYGADGQMVASEPMKAPAPNLGRDYAVPGPDGKYMPNAPLVQAHTAIAEPGIAGANSRNEATNARIASEGSKNRSQSELHFQTRQNADKTTANKPPVGYVWGPLGADGNPTQIAVKGGPADLKMAGALNSDTQALSGSTNSFDRLGAAANELLSHEGLKSIYGLRGVVPNIPGGAAADAAALLNTLKSQVGFGVLQDMRNNSKTGGALGQVSDKENVLLQANLAALEKAQSFEQAQNSLKKIIEYSEGAKGRLRDAYNLKHGPGSVNPAPSGGASGGWGGGTPSAAKQIEKVNSDADYNSLPSGATFVGPDGKTRKKP